MIKFFRHIRKSLVMETGKTSKPAMPASLSGRQVGRYLKYAIGEIILVVIGILFALQINNWNTQRINNLQEEEILFQLKDEFEKNLFQLNQKIQIRNSIIQASKTLLTYRKETANTVKLDSFNMNLGKLYSTPTFDPALGVTSELSNSGKLYLIKDKELRNLITTWPSFLSQLGEEEINIKEWIETRFIPFLIKNYQIGLSLEKSWSDEKVNDLAALSKANNSALSGLFDKADFESLLYNPDFEDYLALIISKNEWANRQSIGVKEQLDMILNRINKNLNTIQK